MARDQLTDDDYELFIWERPDLTVQLLANHIIYGDSVVESFDQAFIVFVMKLKTLCDIDLVKACLEKKE
jgi:hypothetical protein